MINLIIWGSLAVMATAMTALHAYVQVIVWITWTKVSIAGAGREVYVGMHAFNGKGFVYPPPKKRNDRSGNGPNGAPPQKTTFFISPLMKTVAFVDCDRDELRMLVPLSPEGAPATKSADGKLDEAQLLLRLSWSIPEWVVYHDVADSPGDHGKLPLNLRVSRDEIPVDVLNGSLERHQGSHVAVDYFYPGWAAVAYMQEYVTGEHMRRAVEFLTEHAREFYSSFNVDELMRVLEKKKDDEEEARKDEGILLRYKEARIRDESIPVPDRLRQKFAKIRTRGELQQAASDIVTWAGRLELEPYGIFPNDVTEVRLVLPEKLVLASRAREARREDVHSMRAFTHELTRNVEDLQKSGMNPDIAAILVADSVGTTSRPGPLSILMAGLNIFRKGNP